MSNKQIPTPEEILTNSMNPEGDTDLYIDVKLKKNISSGFREVIKYTLEQAAENGVAETHYDEEGGYGVLNKQSILSLEQQIIKDLGL